MPTVIRKEQAEQLSGRLSQVNLTDLVVHARSLVEQAKREAAALIQQAQSTIASDREQATREGYDAGYTDGFAQGHKAGMEKAYADAMAEFRARHATTVDAMKTAVQSIDDIRTNLALKAERDLLMFSLTLAEKLTFAVGRAYPESVKNNLLRAVALVQHSTDVSVAIHPQDMATIEEAAPEVMERFGTKKGISIQQNDLISPGGCKVYASPTVVDATLETQLENICTTLIGEWKGLPVGAMRAVGMDAEAGHSTPIEASSL